MALVWIHVLGSNFIILYAYSGSNSIFDPAYRLAPSPQLLTGIMSGHFVLAMSCGAVSGLRMRQFRGTISIAVVSNQKA